MQYNFTTLGTVVACDTVLADADRERTALQNRKNTLEFQLGSGDEAGGIATDHAQAVQELASIDAALAVMPEGPTRDELAISRIQVDLRRARLAQRLESVGLYDHADKQLALVQVEKRIEGVDEFITALEAYKATLPPDSENAAA